MGTDVDFTTARAHTQKLKKIFFLIWCLSYKYVRKDIGHILK